jgi:hypothetical protein
VTWLLLLLLVIWLLLLVTTVLCAVCAQGAASAVVAVAPAASAIFETDQLSQVTLGRRLGCVGHPAGRLQAKQEEFARLERTVQVSGSAQQY